MDRKLKYRRSCAFLTGLFALAFLAGCGGGGGGGAAPAAGPPIISETVAAAAGGTFTDDPVQPTFTLIIPPGALSSDANLAVSAVPLPPAVGPNQTAASNAFSVTMNAVGGGPVILRQPMELRLVTPTPPVHPQLGEIARLTGATWLRLSANFFRSSDSTVVALTVDPSGTFQVVHRSLQRTTGPAVAAGFDVFMNETFLNENFFGDIVGLHTLLNATTPAAAVALGVQVDLAKVPADIVAVMTGADLAAKDTALTDPVQGPVITQRLIKADAVIGVKGFYNNPADPNDITMIRAGITCALCHINVTPTEFQLTAGPTLLPIGPLQVDGVPNTAMDAGAILAATPFFTVGAGAAFQADLLSWGPGAFDVRALPDNPLDDGANNPTSNPPLWNFVDLEEQGYQFGWDGLFENDGINNNALASQAEAVYDLVMHANGAFGTALGNLPPELSVIPPQALLDALAAAEVAVPGNVIVTQDLLDVQEWMRSIVSPAPGPFNEDQAEQGFRLFHVTAGCTSCHENVDLSGPGLFTFVQGALPLGDLAGGIRIPSLRGVSRTAPYFHNHAAPALADVITNFINRNLIPSVLTAEEQAALVEYLKSL
jgi:hypothetical protein